MALDVNAIIILISLFLIHVIFLCFDLFRRGQNYGYFAYITAVIPVNFLWYLAPGTEGLDVLLAYVILFVLWIINLIRDFFLEVKEQRNHIATLLFLGIGILVQIIITAILPSDNINPNMQENTSQFWYFWLPEIYTSDFGIASWVNPAVLLGYRISATLLILLAIVPLIVYLKNSGEQSLLDLIIIDAIFVLPFIFLSYIWLATALWVLTFLFSVILLIVLLLLTKNKNE